MPSTGFSRTSPNLVVSRTTNCSFFMSKCQIQMVNIDHSTHSSIFFWFFFLDVDSHYKGFQVKSDDDGWWVIYQRTVTFRRKPLPGFYSLWWFPRVIWEISSDIWLPYGIISRILIIIKAKLRSMHFTVPTSHVIDMWWSSESRRICCLRDFSP